MQHPRRRTGHDGAGFPLPFGRRHSLLGASCPARGLCPSHDRPTAPQTARTRAGFPCSARVRPGWLRVPSVPRGGGVLTTGFFPGRRLPLLSGQPCRPGLQPAPGRIVDEASARVHCHSPHASLPLACNPGRNGVLGLFPELRTQPGRTRQRTSGREQAWTLPGYVSGISQPPSTYSLTTCGLTSQRTGRSARSRPRQRRTRHARGIGVRIIQAPRSSHVPLPLPSRALVSGGCPVTALARPEMRRIAAGLAAIISS